MPAVLNSNDIQDALKQTLVRAGLDYAFLLDQPAIWSATLSQLQYIPVNLLPVMLEYQAEYARANNSIVANLSVILFHNGRPCAVWPLIITTNVENKVRVSIHREVMHTPHFVKDISARVIGKLTSSCLVVINELMTFLNITEWQSADAFCGGSLGVSQWHEQGLRSKVNVKLRYELYLNLQKDLAEIRSAIRKSYKSLINQGMKIWRTQVVTHASAAIWDEFRELHRQVSGRVTRSQVTWDMQLTAIDQKNAFFISLRDENDVMVGGALYYWTRDEGFYAVGAYDRTQFDKPLGHVAQYIAIQEMKARGVKWYKLGERPFIKDDTHPTSKELSIAEFKEGFSSDLVPRFTFTHVPTQLFESE